MLCVSYMFLLTHTLDHDPTHGPHTAKSQTENPSECVISLKSKAYIETVVWATMRFTLPTAHFELTFSVHE